MAKIAFFAGHGGDDTGAIGVNSIHEATQTRAIADECVKIATAMGHTCITNGPATLLIDEKVAYANAQKVDCLIEIHENSGGGHGVEVYYSIKGGKSRELAVNIDATLAHIYTDRGIKTKTGDHGDYFGVIRDSIAPAVLVECMFVDSASDEKIWNATTIAQDIVNGVTKVFPAPVKPKPPAPKPPAPKPTMRVGAKVKITGANAVYGGSSKGVKIGSAYKNKTYTVEQIGTAQLNPGQVLLKELFSWVYTKDLQIVG